MTTGAIMAYSPVSAGVGAHTRGPLVDYRFGRIYDFGSTPDGIRYFDLYPHGDEVRSRAITDIGISGSFGPWAFCYNSQYLAVINGPSNGSCIFFLRSTDMALMGTFGTADSSFTNDENHIENPNCMVSISAKTLGQNADIIICNSAFTDGALNAITVQGFNEPLGTVDENHTVLGAKPDGSGTVAYAIGFTKNGGATQVGLYKLTPGIVPILKILPASIDATWTHIDSVYGISIDQTDGNLIAGFTNAITDSTTNKYYLAKINATTGAIMWVIPTGSGIAYDNQDSMKQNLITQGVLYYIADIHTLWTINTITGAHTTSGLDQNLVGALHATQMSEDVTGSVIWWGAWSESTTHPAYLGTYCLVEGHTSGSDLLWRFFPAGTPSPAPTYGIPAQSRRRAWTFTMDGHVFYALDLGQEGTYLFDDTTQQWSKFITQGFDGWNLTNGTVWGQRIVGGDLLTDDIWEMQPGAGLDNGALDIIHVVTGGLVKRSRTYSSVESFRLNCSFGQLADSFDATVQLSFSDDQGQTFTDMDVQSVTEGDFVGEIAWRSLGSFAAPGRIFRITDVGAFLRIDGADAMIDNFDEDAGDPSQQGG